jgi:hypothetical protein
LAAARLTEGLTTNHVQASGQFGGYTAEMLALSASECQI